jgi:hypothetical protein
LLRGGFFLLRYVDFVVSFRSHFHGGDDATFLFFIDSGGDHLWLELRQLLLVLAFDVDHLCLGFGSWCVCWLRWASGFAVLLPLVSGLRPCLRGLGRLGLVSWRHGSRWRRTLYTMSMTSSVSIDVLPSAILITCVLGVGVFGESSTRVLFLGRLTGVSCCVAFSVSS